jgi:hypothetical protein
MTMVRENSDVSDRVQGICRIFPPKEWGRCETCFAEKGYELYCKEWLNCAE